ncbi:polyprotein [Gossypium australe]|uniref:Polyprotein n=1 Tax=Gossypium australe TaxID=47621 RepID=A0A5B6WRU6_9ROSI|nr:polyprotein [Gossypium australe]
MGIVETFFNSGMVYLTFFSNYNIVLKDPTLLKCLKVQIWIARAEMVSATNDATLHYQMAYRSGYKEKKISLYPSSWMANYENFHENIKPIQSKKATFGSNLKHDEKDKENATPSIFTTQFMMQPTFTTQNV